MTLVFKRISWKTEESSTQKYDSFGGLKIEVWFIFFFSKGRDRTHQCKGQKLAKRSSGLDWGQFVGLEGWWYVLEVEIAVGF